MYAHSLHHYHLRAIYICKHWDLTTFNMEKHANKTKRKLTNTHIMSLPLLDISFGIVGNAPWLFPLGLYKAFWRCIGLLFVMQLHHHSLSLYCADTQYMLCCLFSQRQIATDKNANVCVQDNTHRWIFLLENVACRQRIVEWRIFVSLNNVSHSYENGWLYSLNPVIMVTKGLCLYIHLCFNCETGNYIKREHNLYNEMAKGIVAMQFLCTPFDCIAMVAIIAPASAHPSFAQHWGHAGYSS